MRWRSRVASVPFAPRLSIAKGTSFHPCLALRVVRIVLALLRLARCDEWTEVRTGGSRSAQLRQRRRSHYRHVDQLTRVVTNQE